MKKKEVRIAFLTFTFCCLNKYFFLIKEGKKSRVMMNSFTVFHQINVSCDVVREEQPSRK